MKQRFSVLFANFAVSPRPLAIRFPVRKPAWAAIVRGGGRQVGLSWDADFLPRYRPARRSRQMMRRTGAIFGAWFSGCF